MDMGALVDRAADEPTIILHGAALLKDLVSVDDWLPPEYALPDPQRYCQYLLHCDSRERFSIVSFVWAPGQATPIHNHRTWGLIGMLRGSEACEKWIRSPDGALVPDGPAFRLEPGNVDSVSPRTGDIHRVRNALADRPSVSIHVYGANIGRVMRSTYALDGTRQAFVSGYSNAAIPNVWRAEEP